MIEEKVYRQTRLDCLRLEMEDHATQNLKGGELVIRDNHYGLDAKMGEVEFSLIDQRH